MEFSSASGNVSNISIAHDGGETLVADDIAVVVRSDTETARFDLSGSTNLSVGQRAVINVSNGDYKWPDTQSSWSNAGGGFALDDGSKYEVLVIDKQSQQQIASATITARP